MGLFDRFSQTNAKGYSGWDGLQMAGATLRDMGNPGGNSLAQLQQMMAQQQALQAKRAAQQSVGNLFGPKSAAPISAVGGFAGDAPTEAPAAIPSLRDPNIIRALLGAQQAGADISPALEMLKFAQPEVQVANGVAYDPKATKPGERIGVNLQNVNGFQVNTQDPANANRFLPKIADGAVPLYDDKGQVVAQRNLDGTIQALAEQAGATAAAEAAGRMPYTADNRTDATGRPVYGLLGDRRNGLSVGQSAADAEAAKIEATAGAQGRTGLPQAMETANQTLALISQIRNHPGRQLGTGATGVLPGIPGTQQMDFVTLVDQAKGKAFLEAFESLKGGGQITEVEGRKATEAIARLNRAQTEDGFMQALDDLEGIVRTGMGRAQQRASSPARPVAARPDRASLEAEMRRRGLLK